MDYAHKISKALKCEPDVLVRIADACEITKVLYADNRSSHLITNPKGLSTLRDGLEYITVTDGACTLSYVDVGDYYYIDLVTSPGNDRACTFWATMCARLLIEKPVYFLRKRDPRVIKSFRLTEYQISNDLNL